MNKEPVFHMSKRETISLGKRIAIYIAAIVLALIVCAAVIVGLVHMNPLDVYKAIFDGALGSNRRIWITIRDMLVLLCIAVGLAPAFKMRFWNIGAEGQVLIGGVVSAACMIYLGGKMPNALLILLMILLSYVFYPKGFLQYLYGQLFLFHPFQIHPLLFY